MNYSSPASFSSTRNKIWSFDPKSVVKCKDMKPLPLKVVGLEEGAKVEANYRGRGKWYPGKIARDRHDGTFDIIYDDGENEIRIEESNIRLIGGGVASKPQVFEQHTNTIINAMNDLELDNAIASVEAKLTEATLKAQLAELKAERTKRIATKTEDTSENPEKQTISESVSIPQTNESVLKLNYMPNNYISLTYNIIPKMKLLDWIPKNLIDWVALSRNPNAIEMLEQNPDKIDWQHLSINPNAIRLLEQNQDEIDWSTLSRNPNAIHLLEHNLDKIDWDWLSQNPNAIPLLEQNPDKIVWKSLSLNPNAIHILERNLDKISWYMLSENPNAIHLLEQNQNKIYWHLLSRNPNAIPLIEKNLDKVNWYMLSENPNAIHLLEQNQDKIDWFQLSKNPNAIKLLEENIDKITWRVLAKNPNAIHIMENNVDKLMQDQKGFNYTMNWLVLSENPNIFIQ